jgi:hypothetical protein
MEAKRKILGENAARLYNIPIPAGSGAKGSEAPEPVRKAAPVA